MPESIVQVTTGAGPKLHTFQRTVGANSVEDEVVLLGEPYVGTFTVAATNIITTTAASHALQIMAGASNQVHIHRIELKQRVIGTAANLDLGVVRLSTAGTGGGAVTAMPLQTTDTVTATAMTLPTAKGTESGASLLYYFSHQLTVALPTIATQVWTCPIGVKPFTIQAGVANGIAFKIVTGIATDTIDLIVTFTETAF